MRKLTIFGVVAVLAVVGVTFAALSLLGSGPAEAADKTEICHYDPGKVTPNKVHKQHSWVVIEVADSALDMHLANHSGPTEAAGPVLFDADTDVEAKCIERNNGLPDLVPPGPPGQP